MANVYPSGELAVAKRTAGNLASRPPAPTYGKRYVRGTSPNGRRQLRRAIVAKAAAGSAQFVMITLTSQDPRTDDDMRAARARFLAWGRKFVGPWFSWRVWVAEDQARGVLHFHLVLSKRVPKALMLRMRTLWCDTYGMGPGAFDIKAMRSAKGTAKYLGKYLTKQGGHHRLSLGPDGFLGFHPWPVSRHTGDPYARDRFRGNPYGMSDEARVGTAPVVTFWGPAGAFPGLDGHHGTVRFFDTSAAAVDYLGSLLDPLSDPVPRSDG